MSIDPSQITWDSPDPAQVVWDDEPPKQSTADSGDAFTEGGAQAIGSQNYKGPQETLGTAAGIPLDIGKVAAASTGIPSLAGYVLGGPEGEASTNAALEPSSPFMKQLVGSLGLTLKTVASPFTAAGRAYIHAAAQSDIPPIDTTGNEDFADTWRSMSPDDRENSLRTAAHVTSLTGQAALGVAGIKGAVSGISDLRAPPGLEAPPHPLAGAAEAETTRLSGVKSRMEANGLSLSPGKGDVNQPIADAITRQDLGLPKDAPMTHDADGNVPIMDAARGLYAGPAYNEARAIPSVKLSTVQQKLLGKVNPNFIPEEMRPNADGTISGASAVDLSKLLRKSGSKMANSNQILNDGTEVSEMGSDRLKAANALEDAVHDYYVENGQQDKADALYNARVYTAKSYSAEAALDGAGHVRVGALKQQTLRGKPLSGGIADLSQMGLQYPDAFKSTPAKAAPGFMKKLAAGTVPVVTTAAGASMGGPLGAIAGRMAGEHVASKILEP